MKKIISSLAVLALTVPAFAQSNKELESRIEALELSRDLNWIKWGGSLETRYDNVNFERNKDAAGTLAPVAKGSDSTNYYRMWANLNMEAKPNDRLTFFGRLSMAKYMNVFGANGTNPTSSGLRGLSEGQTATDTSTLFLERAFMNYSITDSLIFTMGRLPTIDGPNKHIALNQQLMGNYPTLAYSAILDGFALTKSIGIGANKSLNVKAIYTPTQGVNFTNPNANPTDGAGKELKQVQDGFYSAIVEYEQTRGSFFDKNLSMFQYVRGNQTLLGSSPAPLGDSNLNIDVNRYTFYTDFQRVFGTSFDVAVQLMYSDVGSKGDFYSTLPGTTGWMCDKADCDLSGHASIVTVRYQLPINSLNRPKIGAEWFNASDKAYVYDLANVNPINMYQSAGSDVYHLFWNQDFGNGLSGNFGYMYREQKTTYELAGLLGAEQKVDNVDQNFYVSLLATF